MNKVYINCLSSFLPNESVDNEHIEDFLGYIGYQKIIFTRGMHRGYRYFVLCDNDTGSVGTVACFYGSWAIEMSSGRNFLFFRCLSDFFAGSKDFVQRYSVE